MMNDSKIKFLFFLVCLFFLSDEQFRSVSSFSTPTVSLLRHTTQRKQQQRKEVLQLQMGKEMLSFGKELDISVKLPSTNMELAKSFMKSPDQVVLSTWDPAKTKQLNETMFVLSFMAIPIPGVDTIKPEIEMKFEYADEKIVMKSTNWALKGKDGNTLKDSRFMESFDIQLAGELRVEAPERPGQLITTAGWVRYAVKGKKPTALRRAPDVIVEGAVNFVQNRVANFVTRSFAAKLSTAFKEYVDAGGAPAPGSLQKPAAAVVETSSTEVDV